VETVSTVPDPLEQQLVDDRYRLLRRIGSGSKSVVYLAERLGIGKPIAIKFLRSALAGLPDFVGRFEQESRACSRLNHLNCVSVIDFGVAFGSPYLVMEHVHGMLLSTALRQGPFAPDRAVAITRQILAGLGHAHARGVIHGDLKPGNVMLVQMTGATDFVKIMDFGTAQLLTGDNNERGAANTDVGTPWYLSPEQAAGRPTDARTDLYALGVMLFELITGECPFAAEDPARVIQMHLSSPVPSVRMLRPELGVSPELEAVLVKALQKDPQARFESAEGFDQALQNVPETRPRVTRAPEAPPRVGERPGAPAVPDLSVAAPTPRPTALETLASPDEQRPAEQTSELATHRRRPWLLVTLTLLACLAVALAAVMLFRS